MSTGERIKTARKKAGMTQAELAAKSGLAAISIHQYEAGKRHPQLEQILRIAIALDVEVIELIPEDKQDKFIEYLLEQIAKGKDVSTLKFAPEKARGGAEQNRRARLLAVYDRVLNDDGQQKAVESVEIIAGNPKYQRQAKDTPQAKSRQRAHRGRQRARNKERRCTANDRN